MAFTENTQHGCVYMTSDKNKRKAYVHNAHRRREQGRFLRRGTSE